MNAGQSFLPMCCCACKHLVVSSLDGFKEYSCGRNSFRPYRTGQCRLQEPVLHVPVNGFCQLSLFEAHL